MPQLFQERTRQKRAQHARPVARHTSQQGRYGLAVDVHGVVDVLPPKLVHLLVREPAATNPLKDVRFNQLGPVIVDDSEEILTHPFDTTWRRVRPDVDKVRIQRGNDGKQQLARALYETIFVCLAAEVEVVHAVMPQQTVPAGGTADFLAEKRVDICAFD